MPKRLPEDASQQKPQAETQPTDNNTEEKTEQAKDKNIADEQKHLLNAYRDRIKKLGADL